ncbi:hypothetical protein CONCODRAFT_77977 [Conidiobolus coronatus NRRL 28638]|uniref:MSP domain-containing protein n=1 Tax=Conidiobolus coronatus (strain ATCC 28846 / CBS 209.66 / NRRL 28638) TaxID=796925 RepID=A0A137PAP6_CONC2|nr:hypothetical protein CONCODRAFT_77977 [Conidiobolus coronatus NRRL 28638]|eukprot:KXN72090.1 hypothetical protein CONCODRAFT_77977 [Conidiobolus coronatus NRRL 28638]
MSAVILEPSNNLIFERPLTIQSQEILKIKNRNSEPIAFKVKTNSPRQYCVRPNAGKVEPNGEVEVTILLQPFKEEPAEDFKSKDKFLVQTTLITADKQDLPISSLWGAIEQGGADQIKEKSFAEKESQRSTLDASVDPESRTETGLHTPQNTPPQYATARETSISHAPLPDFNSTMKSLDVTGVSSAPNNIQYELDEAKATIAQLTAELDTLKTQYSELKNSSKFANDTNVSQMGVQTIHKPLDAQIIVGVAIASFLIGSFLF